MSLRYWIICNFRKITYLELGHFLFKSLTSFCIKLKESLNDRTISALGSLIPSIKIPIIVVQIVKRQVYMSLLHSYTSCRQGTNCSLFQTIYSSQLREQSWKIELVFLPPEEREDISKRFRFFKIGAPLVTHAIACAGITQVGNEAQKIKC